MLCAVLCARISERAPGSRRGDRRHQALPAGLPSSVASPCFCQLTYSHVNPSQVKEWLLSNPCILFQSGLLLRWPLFSFVTHRFALLLLNFMQIDHTLLHTCPLLLPLQGLQIFTTASYSCRLLVLVPHWIDKWITWSFSEALLSTP